MLRWQLTDLAGDHSLDSDPRGIAIDDILYQIAVCVGRVSPNPRKVLLHMDVAAFLHRLRHAFDAPAPPPLPDLDEKLALGALLVRTAKSDRTYAFAEISKIDKLLSRLFDLKPIEAAKMRATCEKLDRAAPDTAHFAHLIRETVSFDARADALEALWEVVLSDGEVQPPEEALCEEIREALGLSHEDAATARARANAT